MEKNITLKVQDLDVIGQLKYGNDNKSEIYLTLPKNKSHFFKKLYDNPEAFNINGKFENNCEFTAFYCYVVQALYTPKNNSFADALIAKIDFHSNKESDIPIIYKIEIGKLYLNASDVNDEMSVKKVGVKFSSIEQWIPNNEKKKIFIKQNDCYITISNNFIAIESLHVVTLKQLNEILFDLRVFFEILVLNNNVKTIEKFIYTVDDTQIEEVIRYKSEQQTKEEFLFRYDINSIESILNRWFEAKNTYGKIFSNLSGILNESSAEYLELKFLMLAQWIEAYSREYLNNTFQTIINERVENSNDNKYRKNLKQLLQIKNIDEIIFGNSSKKKRDALIDQIICYRNHLTHLNIKDDLNDTQMSNLYEILKDMIYILLMKELDVEIDDNRIGEIKRKYMRHKSLEASIQKCKDR